MHANTVSLVLSSVILCISVLRRVDEDGAFVVGEQPLTGVIGAALREGYFSWGAIWGGWPPDEAIMLVLFAYACDAAAPIVHALHSKKRAMSILMIVVTACALAGLNSPDAAIVAACLVALAIVSLHLSTPCPGQGGVHKALPAIILVLLGTRITTIAIPDVPPDTGHIIDVVAMIAAGHALMRDAVAEDDIL